MSKQGTETAEQTRREKERPRKREKIPDVEWLFANDGKKKADSSSGFLGKLMRRDWWKLVYTTLIYLLQALPTWLLPLVTNDVIDLLVDRPEGYIVRLIVDAAVLLVVVLQNVPTTMWRSNILYAWERRLTAQIKAGVIRKLQRLSITYHKEMEEGRIQSKFLRDIDSVAGYTRSFLFVTLPAIVGVIVSTVIALYKSPIVTLFFIVIIPLNVLLTLAFRKRIRKDNYVYRKENEGLSSKITTTLQMLTLSKSHGLNFVEEVAVGQKINSVTEAGIKLDRTVASFGSMMWVTGQLLSAVCLFFCVFLAINGTITAGEVILFQSLFSSISGSVLTLINSYPALMAGKEAVRSLSEIINASEIEQDDGKRPVPGILGEVTFEHVYYHYPNEEKYVVSDFNLHVKQGERIAVVGSSGSGKSTVMNLIIGLLKPTEGRILIDGTPLSEMPLQSYRHFISVVPQTSILFSGTIRENITYGLCAYSEESLLRAVEDADINEFLPSLPNGLDTQVGEHGDKLSGGQKQRVSIARALIRDPRILIMDEATSALDNVAEYHVQKAIDKLVKERTTFIVAHRLSTIRNADRIVVMEEGKMVEVGTYEELMSLGGRFCELEKLSRIREEEAKNAS
ncbi:MAG: ABC transporter ATP-binding protein [Clostridia bacterium]|nr:ABC transporter ATP-binding protein [Clostridia bacterium]